MTLLGCFILVLVVAAIVSRRPRKAKPRQVTHRVSQPWWPSSQGVPRKGKPQRVTVSVQVTYDTSQPRQRSQGDGRTTSPQGDDGSYSDPGWDGHSLYGQQH